MRIAIAEDSALFREGLELQLARSGLEVTVTARTGEELLARTVGQHIDAVILDVRMPPTYTDEGLRTAEELIARDPSTGILMLSAYSETAYVTRLFASGNAGRGYLLKDRVDNARTLCDALERICRGESVVDDSIVRRLLARQEHLRKLAVLTEREQQVLRAMAEGRSNAGISKVMNLAEKTVEAHGARIFAKLGLLGAEDANRRVLAVLAWLRASHAETPAPPT
jgi:DNA-binding NarL/FixJ family response regulator